MKLRKARIDRVISGGQTGADRGGLEAAIALRIPHGGFCPRDRLAEDGRIPDRYLLTEMRSRTYPARTRANVLAADGTVVFVLGDLPARRSGTALTISLCRRLRKPCVVIDLAGDPRNSRTAFLNWLTAQGVLTLNVAGRRESEAPGIEQAVAAFLRSVLQRRRDTAGRAAGEG